MPKTNWQDPRSSEIRSTHISGLQEAVGKIEQSIGIETVTETEIPLTEVFIAADDRCRIYQAPEGKRNWISSPSPIVRKNGSIISNDFEIDYGGGAVIFSSPVLETDVITADAMYTKANNLSFDFSTHLSDIAAHGTMARQAIINGNFDVWQRGTTFSNPASGVYTSDRWITLFSTAGVLPSNIVHSKKYLTSGELFGVYDYYNININGSGSGYGSNDYYVTAQKIEKGTRFLCGANKKVTVSFWAKSNIPNKKIGVYAQQNYGTGGTPSPSEVLTGNNFMLSSVWAKYSVTFNTNTLSGKTFGTNNDDHLDLDFIYLWGDTFASTRINTSASENFIAAGDISIAQVQLCAGDTALPFTPKSYAEELILCQRYYEVINALNCYLYCDSTPRSLNFSFKTTKRVAPTCKVYDGMGNENKIIYVTSGYVSEQNKPLYGDVPVSSLSTVTISFVPPAGYINVGFNKLIADAEL